MKAPQIIILISIISVFTVGDIESNNSDLNYYHYIDKLSDSYKQLVEVLTLNYNNFIDRFFNPPNYDLQFYGVNRSSVLKFLSHFSISISDISSISSRIISINSRRITGLLASDLISGHCGNVRINFLAS